MNFFPQKSTYISKKIIFYRHHHRHRSVPKLIYTQEFSDGLILPNNRDDTIDSLDDTDCLAPLGKSHMPLKNKTSSLSR